MRVDQKVLFVNFALLRKDMVRSQIMIKSSVFLPLSQVFSEKTLEYSHLIAELQVFSLFTISLGRPEIFEKVAKIGVGCTFG